MKPPLAPHPVRELWPDQPHSKDRWSRSLWFDRFADPSLRDGNDSTPPMAAREEGSSMRHRMRARSAAPSCQGTR